MHYRVSASIVLERREAERRNKISVFREQGGAETAFRRYRHFLRPQIMLIYENISCVDLNCQKKLNDLFLYLVNKMRVRAMQI